MLPRVGGARLLQPIIRIGSDNSIVRRSEKSSSFHLPHCPGETKLLQMLAIKIKAKNGRNEEVDWEHGARVAYNNAQIWR